MLVVFACLFVNGEDLPVRAVGDLDVGAHRRGAGLDGHQMALLGDLHNGVEVPLDGGLTGPYKGVEAGGLDVGDDLVDDTADLLVVVLHLREDLDCKMGVHSFIHSFFLTKSTLAVRPQRRGK